MKYVLIAMFVLLAAPPLQASWVDMCHAQEASLTDHAKMADEDCCDSDPDDSAISCDSMPHCVSGTAVASVFTNMLIHINLLTDPRLYTVTRNGPLHQFSPPPFRPPIS